MNDDDRAETIERYNRRLRELGPTEAALGWGVKGRSRLRFHILTTRWDFSGASVLDFGCGFADLFGYMKQSGTSADYSGLDINESLLEVAAKRYPDAELLLDRDLYSLPERKWDYVVCSGVFNHKVTDNLAFVENSFQKFRSIARRGFAANFLSSRVDFKLDHTFHYEPAWIVNEAFKYSNNVVLRNDYMPFEFTVFVDLQDPIDEKLTVYESYKDYV